MQRIAGEELISSPPFAFGELFSVDRVRVAVTQLLHPQRVGAAALGSLPIRYRLSSTGAFNRAVV